MRLLIISTGTTNLGVFRLLKIKDCNLVLDSTMRNLLLQELGKRAQFKDLSPDDARSWHTHFLAPCR